MAMRKFKKSRLRRERRGFGKIDFAKMMAIDFWKRDIARIQPGFDLKIVRDASREIIKVQIRGLPPGLLPDIDMDTFAELYKEMESLAIYYQVGRSWEKPAKPPPVWLVPEARAFWERACLRQIEAGNYVERYGPPLSGTLVHLDGTTESYHTQMQLIWVLRSGGDIKLSAFHYFPPDAFKNDEIKRRAITSWNGSMYDYIEKQKLRPEVARDKLAMVNHELHKALLMIFFAEAGTGGIVSLKGNAAHAEKIFEYGAKKWHESYVWLRDWYRAGEQAPAR